MQDNNIREKCRELATRLYELDGEVYESVGSSLGRTFTGDREGTIRNLSALMYTKPDGHLLRSEMALISNMARTIKDKEEKSRLMKKYDEIFQEILTLPETFVATDIMDKERVALNHMIKRRKKSLRMTIWSSVSAVHREVPAMISVSDWQTSFGSTIMMWRSLIRY